MELGRTNPSLGTLYALATEWKLSLDDLMAPADGPGAHEGEQPDNRAGIALPGAQTPRTRPHIEAQGVRWERLTAEDDPGVEFLRGVYAPGSQSCPADDLMRHGGWEYAYIISGRLDVQVAFQQDTLTAGMSINFDSTQPHRMSNPYPEPCTAIWIVVGRQGSGRFGDGHVPGVS